MSGGHPVCFVCFTVVIVSLLSPAFAQKVIPLKTNCSGLNTSCVTLNTMLGSFSSNTALLLEPGIHVISNYSWVLNGTNMSIIGNTTDPSNVIIECNPSYGLIFMDIKRLSFKGLTIRDCGFNGTRNINNTFEYIRNFIFLFYEPLLDFSTGLFLAHITHLEIEDVVFDRNEGFGIVGINVIGNSTISNVEFSRNRPKTCVLEVDQSSSPGGSGGAMFLLYQDYTDNFTGSIDNTSTIVLENILVYENYNCRIDLFSEQHNLLSRSLEPRLIEDSSFIGAGGVTISLAQRTYRLFASVTDSLFRNNFGSFHGSAFEVSQFELTSDSHVYVTNTNFLENGIILELLNGPLLDTTAPNPGGAFVTACYLPIPSDSSYHDIFPSEILSQQESSVVVFNCSFKRNIAVSGSGIQVFSFGPTASGVQDRITIQHCLFENNIGDHGSAVFVTEISYSAFEPGLRVVFDSITVVGNQRNSSIPFRSSGVLDINFINVTLTGNNLFYLNQDSAVSIYSGILVISGHTNFSENVGANGGALNLDTESYLVLAGDNTSVLFSHNIANVYGGGIYVNLNPIRANNYDCFLFFDDVDIFCNVRKGCPEPMGRFRLTFINNDAEFGKAIYGSSFTSCPWNTDARGVAHLSLNDSITDVPGGMLPIIFDPPFSTPSNIVNTVAKRIIPSYNNTILDEDNTVHLYPGQPFMFALGSYDNLNQSVPLTILSQLLDVTEDDESHSQIGESNRFLLAGGSGRTEFTSVSFVVFALENSSYNMTINSVEEIVQSFTVEVFLQFCPGGFRFNNITHGCDCNVTDLEDVMCNEDGTLTYRVDYWLGLSNRSGHIQEQCIFDYCIPEHFILSLSDPDSQCRNNRAGVLCGGCVEGYSRMIGTSACGECSSFFAVLWIIVFALLGIGLFAYLAVWNVTITDGFLNGFIFYTNISNLYLTSFTPSLPGDARTVPSVIIAWLNLDFGIPICFFPGMTTLDLAGLRFIFPLYLLFLVAVFVLCAKYISNQKVANFCQKINVTHVFATLILLSYTSLIRSCFGTLSSIYIDGDLRWTRDPNVLYHEPLHAFLAGFSASLLVILIPFPLLLLFPRFMYRNSYLKHSKPLIDAFIAPLAPGREFWVGLRMIFRIVFFLVSLYPDSSVVVVLSLLITILTVIETTVQPFKSFSRNFVNRALMMNLTIFSITSIYSHLMSLLTPGSERNFNTANLYVFLLMFIVLNMHYLLIRFKCSRDPYEKIIAFVVQKINTLRMKVSSTSKEQKYDKKKKDSTKDDTVTHTSVTLNFRRDTNFEETEFIAYREELLDEVNLAAASSSDTQPRERQLAAVNATF